MPVIVHSDAEHLAEGAADHLSGLLADLSRPRVTLGLAGGGTPAATYLSLRNRDVAWERVQAWMADERWVPRDHPDNNARMATEELFAHVQATLHPVPFSEEMSPGESAADYNDLLQEILPSEAGRFRPDVVLLGIGEDGHTASLFPGSPGLDEFDRLYIAHWIPSLHAWRLTATYPLLHAARQIVFLASGSSKAPILRRVLDDDENLPARRVMDGDGQVTWLIDEAAAADLRKTDVSRP